MIDGLRRRASPLLTGLPQLAGRSEPDLEAELGPMHPPVPEIRDDPSRSLRMTAEQHLLLH